MDRKEWAQMEALRRRVAELEADRTDLLNLVIQPWTRDGDGAKLFKVNLAWWDTASSRKEATMWVRDASVALKRKGGQE